MQDYNNLRLKSSNLIPTNRHLGLNFSNLKDFNPFIEKRLLAKILRTDWQELILQKPVLNSRQATKLAKYLTKIQQNYPLDYLLEEVSFLERKFILDRKVLIPRPETEFWVRKLQVYLEQFFKLESQKSKIKKTNLLVDLGCGTGVIGLSLAEYFDLVCLIDNSKLALKNCFKNIKTFKFKNCLLFQANLLRDFIYILKSLELVRKQDKNFLSKKELTDNLKLLNLDIKIENLNWILVANLPYLPDTDKVFAIQNKVNFEPKRALYAGQDGLALFRRVVKQLQKNFLDHKIPFPCQAYFELDPRNINLAKEIFNSEFQKFLDQNKNLKQAILVNKSLKNKLPKNIQTEIWLDENNLQRVLSVKFS